MLWGLRKLTKNLVRHLYRFNDFLSGRGALSGSHDSETDGAGLIEEKNHHAILSFPRLKDGACTRTLVKRHIPTEEQRSKKIHLPLLTSHMQEYGVKMNYFLKMDINNL